MGVFRSGGRRESPASDLPRAVCRTHVCIGYSAAGFPCGISPSPDESRLSRLLIRHYV